MWSFILDVAPTVIIGTVTVGLCYLAAKQWSR